MRRKHTVVVGGTKGIGRAIVRVFSEENHVVSVIARRLPAEIDQRVPGAKYWAADLLDEEQFSGAWAEILSENGKLNNLVFAQRFRGETGTWEGHLATNLTATKNVIDLAQDGFDVAGDSSIVIVSSIAGHFIADDQPLGYHVAKAGINQMVRYYGVTLGRKGIRVNCVSPGTPIKDESSDYFTQNQKRHEFYKSINPLGRIGSADEIAQVIAFLCSEKASLITGQNIVVDGGLSLQWYESLARQLSNE